MPQTFGEWLKTERERRGLSQNQLAIHAGIDASTVSKYEDNLVDMPRKSTVRKLAAGLSATGIPLDEDLALRALAESVFPSGDPPPAPVEYYVDLTDVAIEGANDYYRDIPPEALRMARKAAARAARETFRSVAEAIRDARADDPGLIPGAGPVRRPE